jgi:pimeloyl-ACP methyl ester carboxylesterase
MVVSGLYKSATGQRLIAEGYGRALANWPVPHQELVLSTCQGNTFVIASGDAGRPPLVLFHGAGSNSAMWRRDIASWAQTHRVYAVDLIGEPGRSAPTRPPLRSSAYVSWLDDVWAQLNLHRASLVGISLGGWLALQYAVHRPQRVISLSLLSPAGVGAQRHLFLVKVGVLSLLGAWGRRRAFQVVAGGHATAPPEVLEFVSLVRQHVRPRMEPVPRYTDEELSALTMPVLVVLGDRDVMLDSKDSRARVEALIPKLCLTYLRDSGHILPPQTDAVAAFLEENSSRGS